MTTVIAADWLSAHRATLDDALAAIRARTYFSAYPEAPSGKIYGETANADGKAAFEARLGAPDAPGTVSGEQSPFGLVLDVRYPIVEPDALIARAQHAQADWVAAGADVRVGVALVALERLNRASFEIAYATMHTTGQPFMMAFQAGGPHAQDRALEAVAYAYDEMSRVPARVLWEKPQGKAEPLRIEKTYRLVPRGIALAIGCSTFPNWNSYPGIFASFVTGNPVIVKPHSQAVLPLAITVEIMRATVRDAGFDPDVVQLAVDSPGRLLGKELALRDEVGIVDYTGGSTFGTWLEANADALVFTEKSGVNSIVIDSTDDLRGMTRNLALSLSLYAGQMCTTPQNIFIPRDGIMADGAKLTFDEVVAALRSAIDSLLEAPERAVEILGAIATDATLERLKTEGGNSGIVRPSARIPHPAFPEARVYSPLLVRLDAADRDRYDREMFGPIAYVIAVDSTAAAFALALAEAKRSGAITAVVYSTDAAVLAAADRFAADGFVSLATNLTGALIVNQSAAFSDYHVSGGNPAGNASLTDAAFVASRFRVIETRTPAHA